MGNRVEDGNRAKNWVVQTSSIPVALYSSLHRECPSPPPLLSPSLSFSRFRLRPVFFHPHPLSVLHFLFLPLCNLEKIIFFRLGVVVSFTRKRSTAFDGVFLFFLFFFLFFSGKRVLFISRKGTADGFLRWFCVLLDRLDGSFVVFDIFSFLFLAFRS